MAKIENITIDPAILAKQRMESAGEDDATWNAAWDDLVSVIATTAAGLQVKVDALNSFWESGVVTESGAFEMSRLHNTIKKSVRAMCRPAEMRIARLN